MNFERPNQSSLKWFLNSKVKIQHREQVKRENGKSSL
jgi:hypothetical protein